MCGDAEMMREVDGPGGSVVAGSALSLVDGENCAVA